MSQQNVNPEQPNQSQSPPPGSQGQPNQSEESIEVPEVSEIFGRLMVAEQVVTELLKGFSMAGQAVNRLESFTFVLVDIILKKELATIEEIRDLQKKLMGHEDLNDFWGVEAPEDEDTDDAEEAGAESA